MPDHIVGIVGYRPLEDGTLNAVYVDAAGRQFIVDPKGRRVYGLWFVPLEEPPPLPPDSALSESQGAAKARG